MSSAQQETTRVCLACGLETQDEISNCPNDGSVLTSGVDPLVGTVFLEKYHITNVLGRGGMSAVYKAKHLMMDRFVAIKFLRQELVHDNVMLQRFQLESKAVSMLKHPHIIAVHDFGLSPQGVPYLIMDFLEGHTVSDLIAEKEFLDPERTVTLFTQICSALAHTHNKGVIHRDIKPSNLIVSTGDDGKEHALVVDYGIAKLLEREASSANKLTASGEVFGSPAFMSPEQCNGSAIDARTDIYALGCVIYNCLTGRPPLLGRNAMETVLMHIRDTPKPFAEIRPDLSISPKLEKVVFKALEKDPDERFQTMTELGSELVQAMMPSNNNTTWVIPPQKAVQDAIAMGDLDHTKAVPSAVPTTEAKNSNQTQNIIPDAVKPSAQLGHADPVVPLRDGASSSATGPLPAEGRGRMNPNSMIMPGSDLFGYDSLMPAAPDHSSHNASKSAERDSRPIAFSQNQHQQSQPQPNQSSQNQSPPSPPQTPPKSTFIEDIPLSAPVRHDYKPAGAKPAQNFNQAGTTPPAPSNSAPVTYTPAPANKSPAPSNYAPASANPITQNPVSAAKPQLGSKEATVDKLKPSFLSRLKDAVMMRIALFIVVSVLILLFKAFTGH